MIYKFVLALVISFVSGGLYSGEIDMKSKLTANGEQIMIQLELAKEDVVGFELVEPMGDVVFIWNEQELSIGHHQLQLDIPSDKHGKHLLRLKTPTDQIDHVIFIQR